MLSTRRKDAAMPVKLRALLIGFAILASGCNQAVETDSIEITDYSKPKEDEIFLVDDKLEDKKTSFDPDLVDRRPLAGWSINASNAVIKLDSPLVKPDRSPELLVLHPSYASALKDAAGKVLPSVNLIDGKAKQFDDGLYAAIDQAYFLGHGQAMKSHLEILRQIREKVEVGSPADDYLAAGLSLDDRPASLTPRAIMLASRFLSQDVRSKPIGFYTWNKNLSDTFRVHRYFAQPINDRAIVAEITRVLAADSALRDDYVRAYTFYARMTNPLKGRTPADLVEGPPAAPDDEFALFPQSTSREVELFETLFPRGLPADADLMRELITAIRSGKVDLKPDAKSGWYEYQAYALETMLLPEKGPESNKLLLTRAYKKRMLEAFQALITKRRERDSGDRIGAKMISPEELESVEPRLRVEPNPTYYLRTARSYAFLANFLESTLGESTLKSLKGLREGGERELDLHTELAWMRSLFYGLYLLSAEDIGLKPEFLDGETVDREAVEKVATQWLASIGTDPDLAADTRVGVPIAHDPRTGIVRLWLTVGVRLTPLEARYATPPSLRPLEAGGEWKAVESYKLNTVRLLIPVDEFAEVEISGHRVLNRAELRAICDEAKTKEKILEAIRKLRAPRE
jgi:hypothetical protein